ncbi:MAG: glycine cleavage system aminomethyltransferase GcvT [Rhizobacter sp.]|nr:glycine cleavage system aminomethyltransferase GcvT [Chlorobiales bacterium]
MKHTPFYQIHKSAGAKLIDFGGFEMPVQYEGIIAEHKAVRNSVGVFDVSHMGEIEVKGTNALAFLQRITTNDVSKLAQGQAQYTAMLYQNQKDIMDGGVVDDLIVYKIADDDYFLIVNASNKDKDFAWMQRNQIFNLTLTDRSDDLSLLAVQGPNAERTLQKITDVDLSKIEYYHFTRGVLAGVEMMISRTGYTGEPGFEICFENGHAEKVWNALFESGKEFDIKPIGLGARDTLRTEMGYSLYGHEIDETTNPVEAGLGWITKLDKGAFNGKEACEKVKANPARKLVGFVLKNKSIARQGFEMMDEAGNKIGVVCSGTMSPSLEKPIGTGYVLLPFAKAGSKVFINIRGKAEEAEVVKTPFLKKS